MKLVEIKNVHVGQVRRCFMDGLDSEIMPYIVYEMVGDSLFDCDAYDSEGFCASFPLSDSEILEDELVGKLGITHEIKDGALVQLPRTEFEIDDVVKAQGRIGVIVSKEEFIPDGEPVHVVVFGSDGYAPVCDGFEPFEMEKVGIIGLTHEFVNEREGR